MQSLKFRMAECLMRRHIYFLLALAVEIYALPAQAQGIPRQAEAHRLTLKREAHRIWGLDAPVPPTTGPTLVVQAPSVAPIKVPPPPNLVMPPAALPQPASGRMPDLEANHRQVAQAYHLLAAQMCQLLAFLEVPQRCN